MSDVFQFKPHHVDVDVTMEFVDLAAPEADRTVFEFRAPPASDLVEEGARAMEWMRLMGHECNPGCRPPFAHMSSGAYEGVAMYLKESEK